MRHTVAYAEKFHGRVLVQGHMVCHCLWRHNLTSFSCFQTNTILFEKALLKAQNDYIF